MKKQVFYVLALALILVTVGCQKEKSFETGSNPSDGSLQSDVSGDCLPKTVNGTYMVGTALTNSNTISVAVTVNRTGSYTISTDTVNGMYFRATGIFTTTGVNTINLKGNGTPFSAIVTNFVVSYDSTVCDIQVPVLPAGSGGPATGTVNCAGATISGGYAQGVALTASNTVGISVGVTTIGTYSITTDTVNGVWFNAASAFTTTGTTPLTLTGHGTGTATGTFNYTVKFGTSTCTFAVTFTGAATGTVNCGTATVSGTYQAGTALAAGNTVQIQVNVTGTGAYTITTDTVNGIWFNASGNFTTAGNTPLTLNGHGTPVAAGTFTFTVKFGASTCTFPVTCTAALSNDYYPRTANSNWSYEWDNTSTDSLLRFALSATNTSNAFSNTYNIFMENDGSAPPAGDSSGYYRKSSGDYFEYFYLADAGLDNVQWVEYTFLKDNVAAGTSWTSTAWTNSVLGTSLTFRFKDSIESVNISVNQNMSTGTVNYQNVIVVVERIQLQVGHTFVDATSAFGFVKNYYAKGVGLIKSESYDPTDLSTPATVQRLRRSVVF